MKFRREKREQPEMVEKEYIREEINNSMEGGLHSNGVMPRNAEAAPPLSMIFTPASPHDALGYPFPPVGPDQPPPLFLDPSTAQAATVARTGAGSGGESIDPPPPHPFQSYASSTTLPTMPLYGDAKTGYTAVGAGVVATGPRSFPISHDSCTSPTASTAVDMDNLLRRDDSVNDFNPPRQAMNSDESDFDWDGDINIDDKGQVCNGKTEPEKKRRSKWRTLTPCLRMIILILLVAPILALPAVLTEVFMKTAVDRDPDPRREARNELRRVRKDTIVIVFTWLAFMWCIICITNWGVDFLPAVIVQVGSLVAPDKIETVKSRLLIYVATKKHIKWFVDSCWAAGSFAFLSTVIYPLIEQQRWQTVFIKALGALVALFALVLLEKILLQIISKNFHQTAYADRIRANKYALAVLDKLGASRKYYGNRKLKPGMNLPNGRGTPGSESGLEYVTGSPKDSRSRNQSRSSSWEEKTEAGRQKASAALTAASATSNFDRPNMTVTNGLTATSSTSLPLKTPADFRPRAGSVALSTGGLSTGGQSTSGPRRALSANPTSNNNTNSKDLLRGLNRRLHRVALADSNPVKDVNSTANAKRLAKTLFHRLQGNNNEDELVVQDFYPCFDTEEEAREAFQIFDKDGNGDISKREMKEKIFYIYKERKDLHTSLRDLSQAVGKLDIIFLTIVAVIWLLIILSIFGTSVVQNMLSIGSFLVALSFVFGNSLRTLFENIVFLFITHPYDSGDLCDIDGTFMYVREVALNSTMFVTWDGRRIYFPNNILSQKAIHNIRRSPNMSEKIIVHVDVYTPQSKILELRAMMRDYLAKESKEFSPDMEIQIQEIDVKLKISMVIEHKGNWQESGRRWARRTKFHYALKEAIEDLGIRYYSLPLKMELVDPNSTDQLVVARQRLNSVSSLGGGAGAGPLTAASAAAGNTNANATTQATDLNAANIDVLDSNSPLRNYTPEQMARLYRRTAIPKPLGDADDD